MNKVMLEGNLTKEIELRGTEKKYCFFSVACNRPYSNTTDFVEVKVFGELAESCFGALKKGNKLQIEGHVSKSKYTNNKGETVYDQAIIVDSVRKVNLSAQDVVSRKVQEVTSDSTAEESVSM